MGPNFVNGFLQPSGSIDICIHTVGLQAWNLNEQDTNGEEQRNCCSCDTVYILIALLPLCQVLVQSLHVSKLEVFLFKVMV